MIQMGLTAGWTLSRQSVILYMLTFTNYYLVRRNIPYIMKFSRERVLENFEPFANLFSLKRPQEK